MGADGVRRLLLTLATAACLAVVTVPSQATAVATLDAHVRPALAPAQGLTGSTRG